MAVFVFTAPVSSVSPVPALCTKEAAVKPALSVTSFALVIVTAPNRFVPPTAPVNSTLEPAAVTPSVWPVALSTVLWNVTSPVPAPVPAVAIVTGRLSVTARRKFTSSAVVVIVRVPAPPNATAPAPFCVTAPSAPMLPLRFNVPAFVNVTTPLVAVVMPPAPTVMLFVVRFTPVAVFVSTNPVSVVKPVPALCTSDDAVKLVVSVTSFALLIVTAPSRVPPTAPVNTMLLAPAVRFRFSAPADVPVSVPWNVMSPVAAPVPAVLMFS